jgi:hypothetical protein
MVNLSHWRAFPSVWKVGDEVSEVPALQRHRSEVLRRVRITAENIAKMFKALTGRNPEVSPEWLERTNKELEEAYAKLNEGPKSATRGKRDDEVESTSRPHPTTKD